MVKDLDCPSYGHLEGGLRSGRNLFAGKVKGIFTVFDFEKGRQESGEYGGMNNG